MKPSYRAAGGERILGDLIGGLATPLALAAFGAWIITRRMAGVVIILIASVPLTAAAATGFNTYLYVADFGPRWDLVAWLPLGLGYVLLGLLFLTPTFRSAATAAPTPVHPPPPRKPEGGGPESGTIVL